MPGRAASYASSGTPDGLCDGWKSCVTDLVDALEADSHPACTPEESGVALLA